MYEKEMELLGRLTKKGVEQELQHMTEEDRETLGRLVELTENAAKLRHLTDMEYEILKQEITSDPDRPHIWHNEQSAEMFFRDFGREYPEAELFKGGNSQYICMNNAACKKLCEMIDKRKAELEAELEELKRLMDDLYCGA